MFPATDRYRIRPRDGKIEDDDESDQDQNKDSSHTLDGQEDFDTSPPIPTEIKESMLSLLHCLDTANPTI